MPKPSSEARKRRKLNPGELADLFGIDVQPPGSRALQLGASGAILFGAAQRAALRREGTPYPTHSHIGTGRPLQSSAYSLQNLNELVRRGRIEQARVNKEKVREVAGVPKTAPHKIQHSPGIPPNTISKPKSQLELLLEANIRMYEDALGMTRLRRPGYKPLTPTQSMRRRALGLAAQAELNARLADPQTGPRQLQVNDRYARARGLRTPGNTRLGRFYRNLLRRLF